MMKKKTKKDKGVLYVRDVPVNVKNFFKSACQRRGITMTQKIVELMREFIQKENMK